MRGCKDYGHGWFSEKFWGKYWAIESGILYNEGKADGPHSEKEIRHLLENGGLSYSDLVFRPGLTRWVTVSECKEFERRTEQTETRKMDFPNDLPATTSEADGWILLVRHIPSEGKPHFVQSGPYSSDQVKDKLLRGEVRFDDHIWKKGFATWMMLSQVEDFDRRRPRPTMGHVIEETPVKKEEPVVLQKQEAPVPKLGDREQTRVPWSPSRRAFYHSRSG